MIKVIVFDFGHTLLDNEKSELYPRVAETLEFLDQKGVKIALLSGTNKEEFRRGQLNDFGIFPYFQSVDFLPHEATKDFRPILNLFKVKPEEVLVVGDKITSEITQAKKIGMKTVRVLAGPEKNLVAENDLEQADYTIENIVEIRDLV